MFKELKMIEDFDRKLKTKQQKLIESFRNLQNNN